MKKWLMSPTALLKSLGALALCFVMLFTMTSALAEDAQDGGADRTQDIGEVSTITYDFGNGATTPADDQLEKNDTFKIKIVATESKDKPLFDLDKMTYQLPSSGLTYLLTKPGNEQNHRLRVSIYNGTDGKYYDLFAAVTVDNTTGLLTVTWDKTSPGYDLLEKVTNAEFTLEVQASVDGSGDVIDLGGDLRYYVDNTAEATFTKSFSDNVKEKAKNLTQEEKQAVKFETTLTQAKQTAGTDEFKDDKGLVRNQATGNIVYETKTVEFTLADMTYNNSGYYAITWDKLQPNAETGITVTETAHKVFAGYTYNETNKNTASTDALKVFSSQACSLTNNYTRDTGSLEISKVFYNRPPTFYSDITADNITNAQKQAIKIKVSGTTADGQPFEREFTYYNMTNGKYTISDIPAGTYTVTEEAMLDGNRWVVAMYTIDDGAMTEADGAVAINREDPAGEIEFVSAITTPEFEVGKNGSHSVVLSNGYTHDTGALELNKTFDGSASSVTEAQKAKSTFQVTTTKDNTLYYVWFTSGGDVAHYQYAGLSTSATQAPAGLPDNAFCTIERVHMSNLGHVGLDNLPVGEYKVTEYNADLIGYDRETTYKVGSTGGWNTPANEGTNPNFEVQVSENAVTQTYFNNKYVEKTSLKVTKTVSGVTLNDTQKAATTFQLQKKNAAGNWENVGSPVKYSEFKSGAHTWNNLTYGEYQIVETVPDVANYTKSTTYKVKAYPAVGNTTQTTSASQNGTTAIVNVINPYAGSTENDKTVSPAEVAFTNTYQPITTSITINKTLGSSYPLTEDANELNDIYFRVSNGSTTYKWVKEADGVYVRSTDGSGNYNIQYEWLVNGNIQLKGLPVGKSYTVTEYNSAIPGYERVTTINGTTTAGDNPAGTTGTLTQGATPAMNFVNTYSPYSTLKVEKSFAGDLPDDFCNEYIKPELDFVIGVKDGNTTKYVKSEGTNTVLTSNINEAKRYPYATLAGGVRLSGDHTYFIVEENRDLNGELTKNYSVTTWSTVDSADQTSGTTSADVYLGSNDTKTVKFTNKYEELPDQGIIPGEHTGVLINHKTWTGLDDGSCEGTEGAAVRASVRFKLSRKVDNNWVEYGTYTLQQLVDGRQTIKDANGNPVVENGQTLTGNLLLPVGTYKFEELDADYNGYNRKSVLSILYENNDSRNVIDRDITTAGIEFVVAGNDIINFSLANIYTPLGQLQVTKTISQQGDLKTLNEDQRKSIVLVLYTVDDDGVETTVGSINLKTQGVVFNEQTNTYSYSVTNLPVGEYVKKADGNFELKYYKYRVREINSISGYNCTADVKIQSSSTAGVEGENGTFGTLTLHKGSQTAKIGFTNEYIRQLGGLKITKTFSGHEVPATEKAAVTFEVLKANKKDLVKWDNNGQNHVYSANGVVSQFTYADMVNGEYVISGLPTGTYYVRETKAGADGFLRTTMFTVGANTDTTSTNVKGDTTDLAPRGASITENGTATVAVTNTYTQTGALKVKKTFAYEGSAEMGESLRKQMTFKLKQGNRTIREITLADATLENGEYVFTFTDLPVDEYTLEESNADHTGYTRTTTVTVNGKTTTTTQTGVKEDQVAADSGTPTAGVTIVHNEELLAQITNSYAEHGTLTIYKEFSGISDLTAEQMGNVVFVLRDSNGTILPDNDSNYVYRDGKIVGTVTYSDLPLMKNNLPAGMYTVEEIIFGESNDVNDKDSLFYPYTHISSSFTVEVKNTTKEDKTVSCGAAGEVGQVKTAPFRVGAGDSEVEFINAYSLIPEIAVDKSCENFPEESIHAGDDRLPVWKFTVDISNLSERNVNDSLLTLTDVFDTDPVRTKWFKLYTEQGYEPRIVSNNGGKVESYRDNQDGTATYVINVKDDQGKAAGALITMEYYLQVADKNALAALLASEKQVENAVTKVTNYGTAVWTFTNTITYQPRPQDAPESDTAIYKYAMSPIRKDVESEKGSTKVTFKLTINPDGLRIGSEPTLTVYDKMSENVTVDMTSFKVYDMEGKVSEHTAQVKPVEYTGADNKWDLVITVPNEAALVITYEAVINEPSGTVTVTNKAEMLGVSTEIEKEVVVTGESDGTASVDQLFLYKYGDAVTEPLVGAVFTVYEADDLNTPVGIFTSNQYGLVPIYEMLDGTAVRANVEYVAVETTAPKGYLRNPEPIHFVMVDRNAEITDKTLQYKPNSQLPVGNAPMATKITLAAEKSLIGKKLSAGMFSFQLLDGNGNFKQEKANDAYGNVTFDEIEYTYTDFRQVAADGSVSYLDELVYEYQIQEVIPTGATGYTKDGMTYDPTRYAVLVTVKLDEAGASLQADVKYKVANGAQLTEGAIPTFTNTYAAEGQVQPAGAKTLKNAAKISEAFSFQIKENGKELATVQAPENADGNTSAIAYPAFKYVVDPAATAGTVYENGVITVTVNTAADIAGTYNYTIAEVKGDNAAITYDNTVYTYTVTVSDNGNGTLDVAGKLTVNMEEKAAADFINTYYGKLYIKKNVTVGGQATTTTLADGSYTFQVFTDEACQTAAADKDDKPMMAILTVTNGVSAGTTIDGVIPGTYYVKEISGTNNNVTMVTTPVKVVVGDDPAATVVPTAEFTNDFGLGELSLTKTVTGTTAEDKEFTFKVTVAGASGAYAAEKGTATSAENTSVTFNANGETTVKLMAGETITIKDLPANAAYTVQETDLPAGYSKGTLTNGAGKIAAGGKVEVTQENTYATGDTSVELKATKAMRGNAYTGNFTFELSGYETTGTNNKLDGTVASQTVSESGTAVWKLTYTQPGTYEYTIVEVQPENAVAGMTYDSTVYDVVVTVTDNGDGTLTATAEYGENGADSLTITNTYREVSYQPKVAKELSGANVPEETYTFQLLEGNQVIDTVTVNGAGEASFDAITKHAAGTYNYTIREVAGTTPGMTYDTAAHTVTVEVSEDRNTGALSADIKYDTDKTALTITNTYDKPEGDAQISVTKAMSGDPYNGNEQFTFTLTPADPQSATNNKVTSEMSQAIAVGGVASWTVDYDKVGTYYYTIQETKGTTEGMIYDETAYTVKVVVDYNQDKTALVSTVRYGANEDASLTVTNKYGETSYQPEVKKVLTGNVDKYTDDETFSFVLSGENMQPLTAQCVAGETAKFDAITYKTPGTYVYQITETAGSTTGMTYAAETITLTVTVERNAATGELTVESAVYKVGDEVTNTFTNIYRETSFQPEVTKALEGPAPEGEEFTFVLAEKDGKEIERVTVTGEDTAVFKAITVYAADTYEYTIIEVDGDTPGMSYDATAHEVTVTVTEDKTTGAISAAIKYDANETDLTITNTYTTTQAAPHVKKALIGDVELYMGGETEEFTFTLSRKSAPEGAAAFTSSTASCTLAEGTADFGAITYTVPGTYTYEIVENEPADKTPGMTYSGQKITYTVVVEQAADATNALTVKSEAYSGGDGADQDTITNKYGETKHQLTMKKVLTGDTDRYLEDETFTFQLLDSEGELLQTKACQYGQTITFDPITYNEVGTYTYTVVEVKPDTLTPGMTYSDEVIVYTVVVYADNAGKLNTMATPMVGDVTSNVITNVYDRPEGEATIEAAKLINGNAYTGDEEFIFTLAQKEEATDTNNVVTGALSQEVVQNGKASWKVAYDTVGTYTYTIVETKGDTAGMVYDKTVHTVTVKVEYDETTNNASLKTTVTYDGEKTDLDIVNLFSEIAYQPEITKAVVDKGLCVLEEVFTFGMVQTGAPEGVNDEHADEAYAVVARVDGDKNQIVYGVAEFQELTYNVPGVYTYEIWEEIPEEGKGTPGMTYSDEIITLTVTVERNETTGELTLNAVYEGGSGDNNDTITNDYVKPDGMALIMVNKVVTGNTTDEDIKLGLYDPNEKFTFILEKTTEVIVPSDTNDVVVVGELQQEILAGKTAVWGLTYDQPGVYSYTIKERPPIVGTEGMAYDETVYNVTVTVEYNETESGLVATVSYDNVEKLTLMGELPVTNKFSAITFTPEIGKTLMGRFLLEETFNFALTQTKPELAEGETDPYTDAISITVKPGEYDEEVTVKGSFKPLVYHEPGTYEYEIVEIKPEATDDRTPGMTYSPEKVVYTVVVEKDETTGELSIASETYTTLNKVVVEKEEPVRPLPMPGENAENSEAAAAAEGAFGTAGDNKPVDPDAEDAGVAGQTFTNLYKRPEGQAEIFVNKAMTGNDYDGDNKFAFVLKKYEPNGGAGEPGEEVKPEEPGEDTGDSGTTVTPPGAGTPVDPDTPAEPGEDTGDSGVSTERPPKPGTPVDPDVPVENIPYEETNNIITPEDKIAIGVDETGSWTIKYDQVGTYYYTIEEIYGGEDGVTYDETIYYVTVVVEYHVDENGDRMSLDTKVSYSTTAPGTEGELRLLDETGEDADANGGADVPGTGDQNPDGDDPANDEADVAPKPGVTFTNKYSMVAFVPEVDKHVKGRGAPSEYFTFQLKETTEGREYWDTARCLAEETAVFDEIRYYEPGTYTYTITEVEPDYKTYGMTYSDEVVRVRVVVEKDETTGALSITDVIYTNDGSFTNRYNPPTPYDYKFSFTKKWQGGVEASLEWTLYDANGNVVHKKFNKDVLSENEWYYEAWFAMDKGYYIIEDVPEGYEPIYVNVGQYADVTDRLYNGGTIINYKAPQTGDGFSPAAWAGVTLLSAAALMMITVLRRKRVQ